MSYVPKSPLHIFDKGATVTNIETMRGLTREQKMARRRAIKREWAAVWSAVEDFKRGH